MSQGNSSFSSISAARGATFSATSSRTIWRIIASSSDSCARGGAILIARRTSTAMNKLFASSAEAVADIPSGASLAVGGFGLNGIPHNLIQALLQQGATDLVTVSNNC